MEKMSRLVKAFWVFSIFFCICSSLVADEPAAANNGTPKKYTLSIATIFKDEAP